MKKKKRRKSSKLNPILSRGIISILLVVFAVLIGLSFFQKAGVVGIVLNDYILSFLFGKIRYTTPVIIVILVWFIVQDRRYRYRATHFIGAILFFLAASSLFHISFETKEMWYEALEGNGGGVFGMPALVLKGYLGAVAGITVLVGLVLVSVVLIFNTAITHFILI
ncbi:DNA translocase FtsK 4TM domain-containing protein, partial [Patescibacteria group bacterium]|nr:DNA translocase FtsK 4TM domain-containing protein [Patescibacteria group bacterium]